MATSLSNATSAGPGSSVSLGVAAKDFGVPLIITGSPTAVIVSLEVSSNGVDWFAAGQPVGCTGSIYATFLNCPPTTLVRLNLLVLTGGSSPSVSGRICAIGSTV